MINKPKDLIESGTEPESTATLFHDIATPLLISKMKAELLVRYMPNLINLLASSPSTRYLLPEDERIIEALASAPEIMLSNLATVQKKINVLSESMLLQATNSAAECNDTGCEQRDFSLGAVVSSAVIKTILLVDDEQIHRDIGMSLLSPLYKVDFAENGLEAIRKCEQKQYDLILMDLHMPKMNGEQATAELRTLIGQNIMIIGLTSLPVGVNRSGLMARGFTDFLEKPLTVKALQNLLRTYSNNA
mgnify:CR=1 FL=1